MMRDSNRRYPRRKFKLWAVIIAAVAGPTVGCGALGGLLNAIPGAGIAGNILGGPIGGCIGGGFSPQALALSDLLTPPSTPLEGEINAPLFPQADNKLIIDMPLPSGINVTSVAALEAAPSHATLGPDGRLYFTERDTGRVRVFDTTKTAIEPAPLLDLAVNSSGRRGLIGIAFSDGGDSIYLTYNSSSTGGDSATEPEATDGRLVRYPFANGAIDNVEEVLFRTEPRDPMFPSDLDGIGPCIAYAGSLYMGHGDRNSRLTALDFSPDEPSGKILRFNQDGSIPGDNPLKDNPMFAVGFRNPVSMTFDRENGTFFIADLGSGVSDEINVGVVGTTYGWPLIFGAPNTSWENSVSTLTYFFGRNPIIDFGYANVDPRGLVILRGGVYPGMDGDLLLGQASTVPALIHRYRYPVDFLNIIVDHTVVAVLPGEAGKFKDMVAGPDGRVWVFCAQQIFVLAPMPPEQPAAAPEGSKTKQPAAP